MDDQDRKALIGLLGGYGVNDLVNIAIAVAQIRVIHARNERYFWGNCRAPHPCRTIRALVGICEPTGGDE